MQVTRVALAAAICASLLWAHPMGNFSVNHYARILPQDGGAEIVYVMDLAEIPTFELFQKWNLQPASPGAALEGRAEQEAREWVRNLNVTIGGTRVQPRIASTHMTLADGVGGMKVMRVETRLAVKGGPGKLVYEDRNYPERTGWKEIVIGSGPDKSQALTAYPTDPTVPQPQDVRASVDVSGGNAPAREPAVISQAVPAPPVPQPQPQSEPAAGPPQPAASAPPATSATPAQSESMGSLKRGDYLSRVLHGGEISFGVGLICLLVAFGLGALHAFEPGHGKTMVAAYLVGSRGTPRHAVLLGLMTTFTHTVSVFVLGFVTIFLSHYIMPEKMTKVLGVISGLSIVWIGGLMLYRRSRKLMGAHTHSHHRPVPVAAHSHDDHAHVHAHSSHAELAAHSHTNGSGHTDDHGHSHDPVHAHGQQTAHSHDHLHSRDHARSNGESHSHDHVHSQDEAHSDEHTHSKEQAHSHSHDHGRVNDPAHTRAGLHSQDLDHGHTHDHSHGAAHSHEHDHGHSADHSHDAAHSHDLDHGHIHDHSHGALHSHEHDHGHSADHSHGAAHSHEHDHGHSADRSHGAAHSHEHDHGHSADHSHDAAHSHEHDHGHSADHSHDAAHSHDLDHGHIHDHSHGALHSHEHDHGHDHSHPHHHMPEGDITLGSLIALGASGGMVPCPAALILLLTCISLGRPGLGILLLLAFSIGLAIVLMATGLVVLYAKNLIPERHRNSDSGFIRTMPVISAAVIVVVGVVMTGVSLGWLPAVRFFG